MSESDPSFQLHCPVPVSSGDTIKMAHGGGGRQMQELLKDIFFTAFDNPALASDCDAAVVPEVDARLAFTTDSFVVRPAFFPGGDIGSLAVNGTVNDLAMSGARPLYLSAAFILEEGLEIETLRRIAESMRRAADVADVRIVTGDTKVVDRGKGDSIYISTSGIGVVEHNLDMRPSAVRLGDEILLSGDIGRHGMAVMAVREGLEFESAIESDCASLAATVQALLRAGITPRVMRDLTRGGLASALVEIAQSSGSRLRLEESAIPVGTQVRSACEILGLDPMYVANEGRMLIILPPDQTAPALDVLRQHEDCAQACRIGQVLEQKTPGRVLLHNALGVDRILDLLSGEQLPRIC